MAAGGACFLTCLALMMLGDTSHIYATRMLARIDVPMEVAGSRRLGELASQSLQLMKTSRSTPKAHFDELLFTTPSNSAIVLGHLTVFWV